MNLVKWWVEPSLSYKFNGGYAPTLDRAKHDARELLRLQDGEYMTEYTLHTERVYVERGRRDEIARELNKALQDGFGGSWA